ncbi:MAG: hypothetical protein MUE65_07115 [Methanomassiliicoccales archaeon]|nr:hypothetical protein [Methanomassiliicoccales archaeon]
MIAKKSSSKGKAPATAAKRAQPKKTAASKAAPKEEKEHEHGEACGCVSATEELFGKNGERSYALRDLWFEALDAAVEEQVAPEPNKREMLFLTLSNSIFDMMMDILPEELAVALAENLDDYLAVTLINKKYKVDLLKQFQDEFLKEKGSNFDTEEALANALAEFEDKFWNSPRKDLEGKSPNAVVEAALKHYDLL